MPKSPSVLILNCLYEFGHEMSPLWGFAIFEAMISINISPLTGFKHLDSPRGVPKSRFLETTATGTIWNYRLDTTDQSDLALYIYNVVSDLPTAILGQAPSCPWRHPSPKKREAPGAWMGIRGLRSTRIAANDA